MFQKAVKREAKGRMALVGPAGSGKSMTALKAARALAQGGKIAAIDTEHGSLAKYADQFDFDVCELSQYSAHHFHRSLEAAEQSGYAVFIVDSLSHFWMGKDGALEFVENSARRQQGDGFGGWKDWRPHERAMVDAMIASPMHIIVTMRTKNEFVEVVENGKKKRKKIGLAPVQREGLEYEFDLVAYMDDDNTFITDKTRCPFYARQTFATPTEKDFAPFVEWLKGEKASAPPLTTNAHIEPPAPPPPQESHAVTEAFNRIAKGDGQALFADLLDQCQLVLGEVSGREAFKSVLQSHGAEKLADIKTRGQAKEIARELIERLETVHAQKSGAPVEIDQSREDWVPPLAEMQGGAA
jgi:hypothetical protein